MDASLQLPILALFRFYSELNFLFLTIFRKYLTNAYFPVLLSPFLYFSLLFKSEDHALISYILNLRCDIPANSQKYAEELLKKLFGLLFNTVSIC